ncbi:hypothetical protein MVEN_01979600 [Mycena venus]|uniref:Uncharacterized protein n=1 Tax=Mycena venus TaxID=2733690 RepID=A0A8H6XEL5_9AGAR|nr:hypothetical protein MVEN_01979600 [Mycena venus]
MSGRLSFPENVNRPQAVGRGERESRPTPGLQNHQDERKRNRQKGEGALETRMRNGTVTGRRAMNTNASNAPAILPLTPIAAPNRPPQTPAIPAQLFLPPQSTSTSSSPSPQLFQVPHPLSSPCMLISTGSPVLNLKSLRIMASPPDVSSFTVTPEQFKLMMEKMSHAQRAEFNQFLDMGRAAYTSNNAGPTSTNSRHLSWDSGNNIGDLNCGLGPFDTGDTNDGVSPIGDGDDDPSDLPWNSTPAGDNEEEGLHQNAQSSLQASLLYY